MTVLIIGAGLVGSQIARLLVEQGGTPVLMDRAPQPQALGEIVDLRKLKLETGDVLKPLSLVQVMHANAVSEVIHLAANPLLTLGAQRDPHAAIELNIMGTANVLEAARICGAKRVVIASSSVLNHHVAGGDGSGDPAREEGLPRPMSIYSACKLAMENLGLGYARGFGLGFAAMRYGAVAGPWAGAGGGGPSNDFLGIVRGALAGEEVVLPASNMEWIYSKDAARATLLAAQLPGSAGGVFNVTLGRLTTPDDLARALVEAIPGAKFRIGGGSKQDALSLPKHTRASDTTLARETLGFSPEYQIADAVRDTAAWFRSRRA